MSPKGPFRLLLPPGVAGVEAVSGLQQVLPTSVSQSRITLEVDPVADRPSLQTGRGQEGPFLHHHPWVTASKTPTTTRHWVSTSWRGLFSLNLLS